MLSTKEELRYDMFDVADILGELCYKKVKPRKLIVKTLNSSPHTIPNCHYIMDSEKNSHIYLGRFHLVPEPYAFAIMEYTTFCSEPKSELEKL